MQNNHQPRIDEQYNPRFTMLIATALAMVVTCAVIIGVLGVKSFSADMLLLIKILLIANLVTLLVVLVRCLICRIRIDENGANVANPLSGSTHLHWDELRTAAIVHLSAAGQPGTPIILLTTCVPEEALTRQAVMSPHGLRRDEHVRIPFTPARKACVEHYLNMQLQEYWL